MKKTTREWVRKAEADYLLAAEIARGTKPFHDQLCFHCQQSAEKFLKALCEEAGQSPPKTHDLDYLLSWLRVRYPSLRSVRRGLLFLTDFAIDTRYPGNFATKRQARAALRWAGKVRATCRSLLGIASPSN
jgi:HEPN domain-containing protein